MTDSTGLPDSSQGELRGTTFVHGLQSEGVAESGYTPEISEESAALADEATEDGASARPSEASLSQHGADGGNRGGLPGLIGNLPKKTLIVFGVVVVAVAVVITALVLSRPAILGQRVRVGAETFFTAVTGVVTFYGTEYYDPIGVSREECPERMGLSGTVKLSLLSLSDKVTYGEVVTRGPGYKADAPTMPGTEGCSAVFTITARKWWPERAYWIGDANGLPVGDWFLGDSVRSGLTLSSGTPLTATTVTLNVSIHRWSQDATGGALCTASGPWANPATWSVVSSPDGARVASETLKLGVWVDSDPVRPGMEDCYISSFVSAPLIPGVKYTVVAPDGSSHELFESGQTRTVEIEVGTALPAYSQECKWISGLGEPGRDLAWALVSVGGSTELRRTPQAMLLAQSTLKQLVWLAEDSRAAHMSLGRVYSLAPTKPNRASRTAIGPA